MMMIILLFETISSRSFSLADNDQYADTVNKIAGNAVFAPGVFFYNVLLLTFACLSYDEIPCVLAGL